MDGDFVKIITYVLVAVWAIVILVVVTTVCIGFDRMSKKDK